MTQRLCPFLLLIFAPLLLLSLASAEGVWRVKGHSFSNVHAWQKGSQVRVSGRVSGGPVREPFQAVIHVQDDGGKTHRVTIRKKRFAGQGETFEGGFKAARRSRWWQVIQIEVVGADPDETRLLEQTARSRTRSPGPVSSPSPAPAEAGGRKFFPLEIAPASGVPVVVFSSMLPVCVTVHDRRTGRLILIKNIPAHAPSPTPLDPGEYTAKIAGDGFVSRKDFTVTAQGGEVCLD